MGMLFASVTLQPQSAGQYAAADQRPEEKSDQGHQAKSLWIPEDATGFFTLWIAAFTGMLAISTVLLWRSTRNAAIAGERQLKIVEAEFVSTHRPRVILRDVIWEGYADIHYTLANVGETQATVVESWVMVEFVERGHAVRPLRSFGHDDLGRLILAAGEMKERICPIPGELSVAMRVPNIRRIGIDGKEPIFGERYFTGTIVYADEIGVRRQTAFRRIWNDQSQSFVRLTNERDQEYAD
jgi:hypothetical protein